MKCSECVHYDDSNTYEGTGFCTLYHGFVKEADNCDDWSDSYDDYNHRT